MVFAPTDQSTLERLSDTFADGSTPIDLSDSRGHLSSGQVRKLMSERYRSAR